MQCYKPWLQTINHWVTAKRIEPGKVHARMHSASYKLDYTQSRAITHAGVDHMGSLCSCCLDCLEDVNSSFNFDPLNFTHTSDEHTTARHAITEGKREKHFQHTSTTAKYTAAQYTIHIILQQCIQILLTLTDRCHMPACM